MSNVTSDVQHAFSFASDFLEVTTAAYVVLATKKIMQSKPLTALPTQQYLRTIAQMVVDKCFECPQFKEGEGAGIAPETDYPWCLCQEELGGTMIQCDNKHCLNGQWFHLRCVELNDAEVPLGDWFCSANCAKIQLGQKAASSAKKKKKSSSPVPPQKEGLDSKLEYSRAVVFRGLFQMAMRDAIRENDGGRIISHWKFLMPHFYQWGHSKYLILGTKLLLAQAGALSQRLAFQLKWTRAVNAVGGEGRNIEGDLQMEHFNRSYKGEVTI